MPSGGCALGSELGYVRVTKRSALRWWDDGAFFASAEPGDELRLCEIQGGYARITIWSYGLGYRIPASSVDSPHSARSRSLRPAEENCILFDISRLHETRESFAINRGMLVLTRRWNISLGQASDVWNAYRFAAAEGRRSMQVSPCTDSSSPSVQPSVRRRP